MRLANYRKAGSVPQQMVRSLLEHGAPQVPSTLVTFWESLSN
jgi:hypothetical protein